VPPSGLTAHRKGTIIKQTIAAHEVVVPRKVNEPLHRLASSVEVEQSAITMIRPITLSA
jgi:hypothetical protein